MNTPSTEKPLVLPQRGSGSHFIVAALAVPSTWQSIAPEWNIIAAKMLYGFIARALEAEGCLVRGLGFVGGLNECLLMFEVSGPAQAARVMKPNLKVADMLELTEIAWWDSDELIWRHEHPRGHTKRPDFWSPDPPAMIEKAKGLLAEQQARARAMKQALKQNRK